jgi:hypothetical protein
LSRALFFAGATCIPAAFIISIKLMVCLTVADEEGLTVADEEGLMVVDEQYLTVADVG